MQEIQYTSLSALYPVDLTYTFYRNEKVITDQLTYENGLTVRTPVCFNSFQDSAINRGSCFVLTSAISLHNIFNLNKTNTAGEIPAAVKLGIKNSTGIFVSYTPDTNKITKGSNYSVFSISPIPGTNEVELLLENKWLQVDENYPFEVRLSNTSLLPQDIHRQRFILFFQDNNATIKTKTKQGYRYLACSANDNILRATGFIIGNTSINQYAFDIETITDTTLSYDLKTDNEWVTYFYDFSTKFFNKTSKINKNLTIPTHFLIDYPIEEAIETGKASINIANLKTYITPRGAPTLIENTTNI